MSERKVILIVEDQSDIRKLIRMTLELGDSEIHEAENGESGWHMVKALRPDLVLLDVMMPGSLDGYQVCQKIRQEPGLCNIPVILLTARGQQADFVMGRQAGLIAGFWAAKRWPRLRLASAAACLTMARPITSFG